MKKERERRTLETAGLLVTLLLGNLLHFVYDWMGQAVWASYISAVNESTWEHMKLLAVPWILWSVVSIVVGRSAACAAARAAGLLAGLAAIPALFYTYTGIVGRSIDVVNVLIFQAAVLLAWLISAGLQKRGALTSPLWQGLGLAVHAAVAAAFAVWTAMPPDLPLFVDPTNGSRGIPK